MTNMFCAEHNINSTIFPENSTNCTAIPAFEIDVTKTLALGLVLMLFLIFGVMGNILVILSVACHRNFRSVTHYFIANLAVADLLLSSVVIPLSAVSEAMGRWVFGRYLCNAWTALDVLGCTASILSLCVISVDRWIAVSYPLQYPSIATSRRAVAAVVALWALSAAISVGPLLGWRDPMPEDESVCRVNEEPGYAIFSAACSFYVPLAVILAMYCSVYIVARQKTSSMSKGRQNNGLAENGATMRIHCHNAQHAARKEKAIRLKHLHFGFIIKFFQEKKAAKTLGIVVGCFVLCWLPFFIVLPIRSIFPSHRPPDTVFKITFWLGYFNSCLNPIIYPCFSQEYKKAFQNVLHGRCLRRTHRTWCPPASGQDPMTHMTLHGPKSPQGLQSGFTDSCPASNASSPAVIPNECSFTAHSKSALNAPETSLTLKVLMINMEGEDV